MKNIFKKNQILITALAVMIAVAGYLNYSGTQFSLELGETDETAATETVNDQVLFDIVSIEEEYPTEDTLSADGEEVTDTPGEAVLTSVAGSASFAAEARLSREQIRAKNKETFLEIINNENIGDDQKQDAIQGMNEMTTIAEQEAAAELLLESKGFTDAVVSITDGTVDVVISQVELTDAQRAQVEDIVRRKTEISGENIVITQMAAQTAET